MAPGIRLALLPASLLAVLLLVAACDAPGARAVPAPSTAAPPSVAQAASDVTKGPRTLAAIPDRPPAFPPPGISTPEVRFERISVEQGLSQSTVTAILQDRQGFMWFGTEDGLNKYDGYDFTVYRHNPEAPAGLSHDRVLALVEDAAGVLWIGTEGGGLDTFDPQTGHWRNFRNDPNGPEGHFKNWIVSIIEGPEGLLWIGTYGGGLYQFDREKELFTQVYDQLHPWIQTLFMDRSGILWIGTGGEGLYRLEPSTGQLTHYPHHPEDPHTLSSDSVISISEDRSGTIWVGTILGGLNAFDPGAEHFVRYQPNPDDPHSLSYHLVSSVFEDRSGVLWVGTGGGGLNRFDRTSERFYHYLGDPKDQKSVSSNVILSMYEDQTGALWIGTMGGGISRLPSASEPFRHYRSDPDEANSLSNDVVNAIWQDSGDALWIGTDGGLNRLDRERGQWRHYLEDAADPHSLSRNRVRALHEDQAGVLWVGLFDGGLDRFDHEAEAFDHFLGNDSVIAIYEDREGVLWLGTQGQGLYEFDPEAGIRRHYPQLTGLASSFVRAIHQDRSGALWFGTDDGLHRLDRETGVWRHFHHDPGDPHSLSRGWVATVYQDNAGVLWIGTAGGGLNRFDPAQETFTRYTKQDGLANDEVYGIMEEAAEPGGTGGYLWLSTNNGLSRFDPRTEEFTNFQTGSGLQINKFTAGAHHQSPRGEMFAGGVNGFVAFHPDQIRSNPHVPPVVLTSLSQEGRALEVGSAADGLREVTLRWPDNSFEFEFAALNYAEPEKNQHAYRLEGFDGDWIYIGTARSGRYTNLPGGTYTLYLKGSNNDGLWNEDGVSLRVTVVPPIWQTAWFWGIAALVLVGAVIGGYRLRVRSIEARSRELEVQVEERTAELSRTNLLLEQEVAERRRAEEALAQKAAEAAVAAERSRLARELHDAVTQTLFSASLIAETLPRSWERDQERGRRLLQELRRLSRGALAEMRTLLLELRPAALVEANLGDLMHQLAEAATGQGGLQVTVAVEGDCSLPPDVHVALYRIAQEALNNAVKHARANQVQVRLRCTPVSLPASDHKGDRAATRSELSVRDDGRGFDPQHVPPQHLGLGIMCERAQAIGAILTVDSQPGQGTQVTVSWGD